MREKKKSFCPHEKKSYARLISTMILSRVSTSTDGENHSISHPGEQLASINIIFAL